MDRTRVINEKKGMEMLGAPYLDHRDKKVVQYVIRSLRGTGAKLSEGERVEFNPLVREALGDFEEVFGFGAARKVESTLYGLPIQAVVPLPHGFSSHIVFSGDSETKKIDESSGKVDHFKTYNGVSAEDRVFLGHEFIHMSKDLNFDEYKSIMVCNDVIPMLYELIKMGDYAKEILSTRFYLLEVEMKEYEIATKHMKSGKDKDLYKVVQSRAGQYLNSFYYTVVLYKMYQNDPQMILGYMRRVVNREMTTLDMLKDLGIYLVDNNEMYDEQVQELRRIVRK